MSGKENLVRWSLCVLFLLAAMSTAQTRIPESSDAPRIIYVDDDADGFNTGTSWTDAINSLQDALLLAYFYEKPVEIRVAQGIYTPDKGVGIMPGDPRASFQLINGVTIKGGYSNSSHRGRGADIRDINQYKSILSGDLNADDGQEFTNNRDNSYHVVTASRTDATAVLDGFTVTGGNGNAEGPLPFGGGVYNNESSPTLINCIFSRNAAGESGGGMYNYNSNPILLNCIFIENAAPTRGSGMYNFESNPTLTNCTFISNRGGSGGGMYNFNSRPMLADCAFSRNSALNGGGMFNENSAPALLNCTFGGNSARRGDGGGMENISSSNPTLTNCIFSDNSAYYGGAIHCIDSSLKIINNTIINNSATGYGGGGVYCGNSSPMVVKMVVNTILWNNSPDEIYEKIDRDIPTTITVTYSDVKGGFPGEGNIDVDPLFADPDNGDYHLKSQAGRWDPISQSWVIDQISSSCIDAGDPGTLAGLERFPNGGRINIGAYGGTPEASLSFRQISDLPGQASNPEPADGAIGVYYRNITLKWTAGLNAVWHNVYFGLNIDDMALVSSHQTATEFEIETLEYDTAYYWRIDEVNSEGITTGEVWTFRTAYPSRR
jgi:predicted outer membrane repeat protein